MKASLLSLLFVGAAAVLPAEPAVGSYTEKHRHASELQRANTQSHITPIQKVIQMLNDMIAKGKKEKEEEAARFTEYKDWCRLTSEEKAHAIKKGEQESEQLSADIASAAEQIERLTKEIAGHNADIDAKEAEIAEATKSRDKEHADFQVEYQDYTDSIDSVERAKATIEAGSEVSLLQRQSEVQSVLQCVVSLKKIPDSAKRALRAFLQTGEADDPVLLEAQAPEAKTFESQSGGVLDLVKGMGQQFEDKREEVEKDEMTLKHGYDMIVQDMTDFIENASKNRDKKSSRKSELAEQKGQNEGDLAQTQKTLAVDKKFLEDLTIEEEQKDKGFEKRQEVRQGEVDAITQAIEIMSSDEVSGAGSKHLPGLVQTANAASLVQLRSNAVSAAQKDVAAFLAGRAKQLSSRLLAMMAEKVKADPFKKIGKMIKDMVDKLMTEANEEAEHKGFCDQELGTNKQTRDMKTEDVEELTAMAQKLTSDVQMLADDISRLSREVTEIDASVAKATALREAEKVKNAATIADGQVAQTAVSKAMTVLKEFYDKAATQAFAQEAAKMPGAPATFEDEAYTGQGAEGGILGMLETIESDFARLIAETTGAEQEARVDFEKFSADSSKDKAIKNTDINSKKGEQTRSESDLQAANKDLKTTKEELGAAMDYYEKLKPSCVNAGTSYEERVAKRKEEIESLKEALSIIAEGFPDGA